jgi:hypothetical protein
MDIIQEMKQLSVSEILKEHSLVVPEIQREYVWGFNEYDILESFLEDIKTEYKNKAKNSDNQNDSFQKLLETASEEQKKIIAELIDKQSPEKNIMNIGFLYSYKPNYYISDVGKDAYLIDGQQRFTTIFLVLLYLAIKENRLDDFYSLYRINIKESRIAFDYRVRSVTHNFIIDLVGKTKSLNDLLFIAKQRWFLTNYKEDTTVSAIVGSEKKQGAFEIINKQFSEEQYKYFDFVKDNIKFWHFKTEETSQGEELYITMNSRGQQLADNETIRAMLFKSETAKKDALSWSEQWEQWQDFFWKKRISGETSADKGFNEFLCCIAGLQNFIHDKNDFYSKEEFERYNQVNSKDLLRSLTLNDIKIYFEALKYFHDEKASFESQYSYSNWIDMCITDIWDIFNKYYTNWFANYLDANRATERNRMIFIWSFLYYYKLKHEDKTEPSKDEFFRLIRLFYLRYNNFNRSVSTLKQTINLISINGVFDILPQELNDQLDSDGNLPDISVEDETDESIKTKEEIQKYRFLNKFINEKDIQRRYEELFWEIEDHKFNLKGRDVGSVNIGYLIDLNTEYTLEQLEVIKDKLYEIFPEEKESFTEIQNVLLQYGEFWHRVSPWYYFNFQFDNWYKIIRDRDHYNKHTRNVFKRFFDDFTKYEGTLQDFIREKEHSKIEKSDCKELYQKLLWYNEQLHNKMWSQGNYIAISNGIEANALPDYQDYDKVFQSTFIIYNTKGNLKGGSPKELSALL